MYLRVLADFSQNKLRFWYARCVIQSYPSQMGFWIPFLLNSTRTYGTDNSFESTSAVKEDRTRFTPNWPKFPVVHGNQNPRHGSRTVKLISHRLPVDALNPAVKVRTVESLLIERGLKQFFAHTEIVLQSLRTASLLTTTSMVVCSVLSMCSTFCGEHRTDTPFSNFKTRCALKPTIVRSW